jgi:protein-serine/threonine kinase
MRKHGVDLEDNATGDGLRTKRLDRKDLDALMGGDGQGGIFTWREKNRRKVRNAPGLTRSSHLSNSQLAYSV